MRLIVGGSLIQAIRNNGVGESRPVALATGDGLVNEVLSSKPKSHFPIVNIRAELDLAPTNPTLAEAMGEHALIGAIRLESHPEGIYC